MTLTCNLTSSGVILGEEYDTDSFLWDQWGLSGGPMAPPEHGQYPTCARSDHLHLSYHSAQGEFSPDFSVVLFRPNFMLASEEHLMKVHKNQWFLNSLPPPDISWGATN